MDTLQWLASHAGKESGQVCVDLLCAKVGMLPADDESALWTALLHSGGAISIDVSTGQWSTAEVLDAPAHWLPIAMDWLTGSS